MKESIQILSIIGLTLLMAACSTVPFSQVDGQPLTRANPHLLPVTVVSVDGQSVLSDNPVRIDPGKHIVKFIAPPAPGFRISAERFVAQEFQPCMRYVFGANRPSTLLNAWEPVLVDKYPVAGCQATPK